MRLKIATHHSVVESVAAPMLATFGHEQADIRNLLVRMSFSSSTVSANAVFRAILALSSVHRYGLQSQAVQLKIVALRALSDSLKTGMSSEESMQHLAAGMLLCSFEVRIRYGTEQLALLIYCL